MAQLVLMRLRRLDSSFKEKFKMKKLLIAYLLGFGLNLTAQNIDAPRKQISLMYGLSTGLWKDQSFAPLRYDLNSYEFGLRYQSISAKNHIWNIELNGSAGMLSHPANAEFETTYLQLNNQLSYLWRVRAGQRSSLYFGPKIQFSVQASIWEDSKELSSAFNHFSSSKLAACLRYTYQIANWDFMAEASLPLYSFNSRTPFNGAFLESSEIDLAYLFSQVKGKDPLSFTAPELRFGANYQLHRNVSIGAQYQLNYLEQTGASRIAILKQQLMASLNFKF